jgi:NifU-like protein involved in Fe-S cluster formation
VQRTFSERAKLSEKLTKEKIELLKEAGYSRNAIDVYGNRVNVGIIENADVALAYTGLCGDTTKLYLKINNQNKIEDAKFQYLGCPASAVCGSILTQIAKGKTLQAAKEITEEEILKELGGLPGDECHCAELVVTALRKTIKKYESNKK